MKISKTMDADIMAMLLTDRAAGFRMLFDNYYTPLCLYSVQLCDDFDAAEDIVQSLFVQFWESDMEYQIRTSLSTYLFSVVRNNTLYYMRKAGLTDSISADDSLLDEHIINDVMSFEVSMEERKKKERELHEALKVLSPKELEALESVVVHGNSYNDASDEMGVSVNTLKTHLKRAMKKLRGAHVSVLLLII